MDSPAILQKIKWNGHKKEIIAEQQYLFDNSWECDCVLISSEGKRLLAHQVVLSSSSEFFRKMLSEKCCSVELPLIHIPDADTCVLEAILRFIYTGETTIASGYLTSLLEFCHFLTIKGCVANGFTLNGSSVKVGSDTVQSEASGSGKYYKRSCESWSSEEYLIVTQAECTENNEEDGTECNEPDYLEEYLDDDGLLDVKEEQMLSDNEYNVSRNESAVGDFIAFDPAEDTDILPMKSSTNETQAMKRPHRQGIRSTNSQIDKALNEVNNGKTIHRLSVEYNLPRSTLYHRFRNNENLKQNYRLERKSALDMAVRAVLHERLSLKMAADRYKIPKTAIWREVRKCEQYQPSNKEITEERQNAQLEILSGKSLTSISAKYGITFNVFLFIFIYHEHFFQ